ncbi:MAG: hypothetical protein ACRD68_13455 [Pyrinomonadaceae bacterium]
MRERFTSSSSSANLDELGAEGWELAGIDSGNTATVLYFKRRK